MVYKFLTVNLTEDPPTFDLHSPPASPSSMICLPLNPAGCSFIKAMTSGQAAAGASPQLANPAPKFGWWRPKELIQYPEEGRIKRFTFRELKVATNNFRETEKVGQGWSGCVYKGVLGDGSIVAIKRINRHTDWGEETMRAEVKMGNMVWHRNLLLVRGFCSSLKQGDLLVYPFMVNGSLDTLLRGESTAKRPLDWHTREKIAIGAARGISHLHDLRIIHRDIKPANILLDEDFEARIGDFGLALFMEDYKETAVSDGEDPYVMSSLAGTRAFVDPERWTGRDSAKRDVYGFGVTLLELISCRRAWEILCLGGMELRLPRWAHVLLKNEQLERLVDANMLGGYNKNEVEKIIRLALLCTQFNPKKRPYMSEAVLFLEGIINLEKRWEEYQPEDELSGLDDLSSSSNFSSCPREEELSGPR